MTLVPLALIGACAVASLMFARCAVAAERGGDGHAAEPARRAALARRSETCFKAALLVCFITLPASSTTIFRTLHCDELDHGERFLHADLSVDCASARHGHVSEKKPPRKSSVQRAMDVERVPAIGYATGSRRYFAVNCRTVAVGGVRWCSPRWGASTTTWAAHATP